jgi:UPF0271 protein
MLLNADLGESYGAWTMGMDEALMPLLDQANIACGGHAGDPLTMRRTLELAKAAGVQPGAHPSYPDLQGFGRRSMKLSADELEAQILFQISALDGIAQSLGHPLAYVKPHGALYNDMMADSSIRATVMRAVSSYHRPLKLMLLATAEQALHLEEAAEHSLELLFEAFADRAYTDEGKLVARNQAHAVHGEEKALEQALLLAQDQLVVTESGQRLEVRADTLCVHGDNPAALALVKRIRESLQR